MNDVWPQPDTTKKGEAQAEHISTFVFTLFAYAALISCARSPGRLAVLISGIVLLTHMALHTKKELDEFSIRFGARGVNAGGDTGQALDWSTLVKVTETTKAIRITWPHRSLELKKKYLTNNGSGLTSFIRKQAPPTVVITCTTIGWLDLIVLLVNMDLFSLWAATSLVIFFRSPLIGGPDAAVSAIAAIVVGALLSAVHCVLWLGPMRRYAAIPLVVSIAGFAFCFACEAAYADARSLDFAQKLIFGGATCAAFLAVVVPVGFLWDRLKHP